MYPPTTPLTIKSILPLNSFFTLLKIFRGSWPEIFALVEISAELEYSHNFLQTMCVVTLIATFEELPFIEMLLRAKFTAKKNTKVIENYTVEKDFVITDAFKKFVTKMSEEVLKMPKAPKQDGGGNPGHLLIW